MQLSNLETRTAKGDLSQRERERERGRDDRKEIRTRFVFYYPASEKYGF